MKVHLLFLAFFLIIMLCGLASALTQFNYTAPASTTGGTATTATPGIKIIPNRTMIILSASQYGSAAATDVFIKNSTSKANITNASFNGGTFATFSQRVILFPGEPYDLVTNGTGTWAVRLLVDGSWPKIYSAFNLTGSYDNAGNLVTTEYYMIAGFNYTYPNVTLVSPSTSSIISSNISVFNSSAVGGNFANATIFVWNSTGDVIKNVTNTVLGSENSTTWNLTLSLVNGQSYKWNAVWCELYINYCQTSESNFTFGYGAATNSNSYNTSTYETASESFISNISTVPGTTISSANLIWNRTAYSASVSSTATNEYILSRNIDIPTGNYTTNWFWQVTYGSGTVQNLTSNSQAVNALNLTLCLGAPQNIPFINFTFKNETTAQTSISATITSTWTYWLGSGSVNKTLTYINNTESSSYAFCASPGARTLNVNSDIQYSSANSIPRDYDLAGALLSNSTTNTVLYLLDSSLGIYTRYRVLNGAGNVIDGASVSVTRSLGGSTIQIFSGTTDSSGQVAIFLDPTVSYDYAFSADGVGSTSFSLTPNSLDFYTITLGSTSGSSLPGSTIGNNLSIIVTPVNSSLQNNTIYTFGLNVSGATPIILISMNLTNSSGHQIGFANLTSAGYISVNLNTGNNSQITGYYIIQTQNETITSTEVWTIGYYYTGDYSLFRQLSLFENYQFTNYFKILLAIVFITFIMIFLSTNEIIDTSESKIMVVVLLVWGFSIVGWFNTGIMPITSNSSLTGLSALSNQYGIAIITSAFGLSFILRRAFT